MPAESGVDRLVSIESNAYVVESARLLYVRVPKAACSTMLWTLAAMVGVGSDELAFSSGHYPTRPMTIHDASIHPVPTIDMVSPDLRREALTSPEWIRVAITRDPYARLYSAWESRILFASPGPWAEFPQPAIISVGGNIDVAASFQAFVEAMEEHLGIWQADPHFAQQVHVMALDEIDFTDIVPTSKLDELFDRLSDRGGRPLHPERHNEGLGLDYRDAFDEATARRCEAMFALDFDRLGYGHQDLSSGSGLRLSGPASRTVAMLQDRNRRIGDLSERLRQMA